MGAVAVASALATADARFMAPAGLLAVMKPAAMASSLEARLCDAI